MAVKLTHTITRASTDVPWFPYPDESALHMSTTYRSTGGIISSSTTLSEDGLTRTTMMLLTDETFERFKADRILAETRIKQNRHNLDNEIDVVNLIEKVED